MNIILHAFHALRTIHSLQLLFHHGSILMCLMLVFGSGSLFAQGPGSISGRVKGPEGGPVAGAAVILLNSDFAVLLSVTTSEKGEYLLNGIRPGHYLLQVRAKGFHDAETAVTVGPNDSRTVDIELGLESLSEQVTVTSSRDRVDSVEAIPNQVNIVTEEEIRQRAKSFLAQAAAEEVGVTLQRTSPTIGSIFIRGLTGNKVNVFLDGIRYSTGAMRGGINTFFNLVNASALERIEILRGPSSSQYGSDAIGGSIQLLSRVPLFTSSGSSNAGGATLFVNSSDNGFGSDVWSSYSTQNFAVIGSVNGNRANEMRPGEGIDSRNAVTRFFDISSDQVFDDRLPDTEFTKYGGLLKLAWSPGQNSQVTAGYTRGQQDDGKRYDQLIGGDGNLIADLRNLMLDLFYLKYDQSGLGWFDHFNASYSFNTQREERVNQGGNGNPRAAINHEYERTSVHGFQAQVSKLIRDNQTLILGSDYYDEGIKAPSFREDAITHAFTVRRGRVPDGATFNSGGVYAEYDFIAMPDRLRLFSNIRYGFADYEARAADAPVVNGKPLWPDDSLNVDSFTYRVGTVFTATNGFDLLANFSIGFRAPHITDLGTLGLTGSGFEVAFPEVQGLGATIGSSASSTAVSTGIAVEELKPETSRMYEFGTRYHRNRVDTDLTFFINDIDDNIVKQALILPPGAVGLSLGDEIITSQNANGVVFVSASSSPVLVRTNLDNARIWGLEYTLKYKLNPSWSTSGIFTYLHAEDRKTGLPPNIEGGTPAPEGYLKVRYTPRKKKFWVEPFVHFALKNDRLSSLDLEDRRTGAGRSASSITSFFYNGATVRGLVGPGPDGIPGNGDDVLLATGETLQQILTRVLGPGLTSNSLFTEIPGYATLNIRFAFTLAERHNFLIELENLTDENYRGISWGVDAPGRGIYINYNLSF